MAKIISGPEAAGLIPDGANLCVGGFLSFGLAEEVLCALERRFVETGHPRALRLMTIAGLGGDGKTRGINHFAHPGFIGRLFSSNMTLAAGIAQLAADNDFPIFMAPQGVMSHLIRAIAGKKPGVLTHVGLKTFADPRVDGCRINQKAWDCGEQVVQLLHINGQEQLLYPAFPLDFVLIKGSRADAKGNIDLCHEAMVTEQFELAAAAKNSGGVVIAQVDSLSDAPIPPRDVVVPGILVDYIVVGSPENSRQHYAPEAPYVPTWAGEGRVELSALAPLPFSERKVIVRRAALELRPGAFVNLGIGMPTDLPAVLNEQGKSGLVEFSIESGVVGGLPAGGLATGASYNPDAILKQPDIFDFYDGGGVDIAVLGGAEFDQAGNVNVSRFGHRVTGPGGFINISQNAKTVLFTGTFLAKDGTPKFKRQVGQITFSGEYAREKGSQQVLYITERAVFRLEKEGLTLTELAPGADLERDILAHMEFAPRISPRLQPMPAEIFRP